MTKLNDFFNNTNLKTLVPTLQLFHDDDDDDDNDTTSGKRRRSTRTSKLCINRTTHVHEIQVIMNLKGEQSQKNGKLRWWARINHFSFSTYFLITCRNLPLDSKCDG